MVVDSTDRARVGIAKVSGVFSVSALPHLAEMHLMIYICLVAVGSTVPARQDRNIRQLLPHILLSGIH